MAERAVGITIDGLAKQYDGRTAVDVPALAVQPERRLVLIGPSGCGKSTLLRLILGLVAPDRGRVTIGDTPLTASTRRPLRLRIGYVVQEGGLFPHLDARGNVSLVARDLGWPEAKTAERVDELAALTGIAPDQLGRLPAQLSGGQRQRIGLMRALMLDPAVLLMDEPLGALDPIVRARLQAELRALFARLRKTVLLVTHDIGEAAYLGDEIALMREGRIVQRGPFEELVGRPAEPYVTEFIRAQRPPTTDDP